MGATAPTMSPATRRCSRAPSAGPVRVQLTRRAGTSLWEPKGDRPGDGCRRRARCRGAISRVYDFATRYPSNGAPPLLALLLTGKVSPDRRSSCRWATRTAIPPVQPIRRCARRRARHAAARTRERGCAASRRCPNTLRARVLRRRAGDGERGEDPVAFRLRHLPGRTRAAALVAQTAARADWQPRSRSAPAVARASLR